MWKRLAGKRYNFSFPQIRLSAPLHHPSSTEDSSTTKEQKLTKQYFLPPPHRFSAQNSQYQYWKASKYSILTVIEVEPPVSESLIESQHFMPLTNSEHKFHKTGIGIWLHIGFNLALITTKLCSTTNGESLKVLYTHPESLGIILEIFHFPETVQVLSNPTPII